MKSLLILINCLILSSSFAHDETRYLFYIHQRFLESHEVEDIHPAYGRAEYREILKAFKDGGFQVISEKRKASL